MRRFLALLFCVLLAWPAQAAVTANSAVTPQTPKGKVTTFKQGTDVAGTYKTIYTGGTNGSKLVGLFVSSTDGSAAHLVTVQVSTSTTDHCATLGTCAPGAAVNIPVNSGFASAAPAVNFLSAGNWPGLPGDSDGNPFLFLTDNTFTLEATFATALTAATEIAVTVIAADF